MALSDTAVVPDYYVQLGPYFSHHVLASFCKNGTLRLTVRNTLYPSLGRLLA